MNRSARTIPLLLGALVLIASASSAAAQTQKLGVFDPQRVSEETAEGRRVQANLEAFRNTKQQEIDDREKQISALQQTLKEQALSLSAEKRTSMEIDIQRRLLQLNNAKDLASRELQLEAAGAEAQFSEKLRVVINQFGRDEGFSVILDIGAVAWAAQAVDVTSAVIDRFDKVFPGTGP